MRENAFENSGWLLSVRYSFYTIFNQLFKHHLYINAIIFTRT